jgi:hypothetical protein
MRLSFLHPSSFCPYSLLRLLVPRVLAAAAAELAELQTLRGSLLILRRHVITTFAFRALKHNVVARHTLTLRKLKRYYRKRHTARPRRLLLFDHLGDGARSHRSPTLANGKP